jgi:hypothetical protein
MEGVLFYGCLPLSVGWWLTWFRNKEENTRFVFLRTLVLFRKIVNASVTRLKLQRYEYKYTTATTKSRSKQNQTVSIDLRSRKYVLIMKPLILV